jgi:hypothetical protein
MAPPLCMRCCDRARVGEISRDEIHDAVVTLQGVTHGDIIHLCEECFQANCAGGMEVSDAVQFTPEVTTLSTDAEHPGHDDARKHRRPSEH